MTVFDEIATYPLMGDEIVLQAGRVIYTILTLGRIDEHTGQISYGAVREGLGFKDNVEIQAPVLKDLLAAASTASRDPIMASAYKASLERDRRERVS